MKTGRIFPRRQENSSDDPLAFEVQVGFSITMRNVGAPLQLSRMTLLGDLPAYLRFALANERSGICRMR